METSVIITICICITVVVLSITSSITDAIKSKYEYKNIVEKESEEV